jgi:peptide deformylase
MIFPISVYGDPVLRKVAEPIGPDYPGLTEFLADFWETMYFAAGAEDDPSLKDFKKVFINPEILERSGEPLVFEEGCLSLPEIRENITRPETVRIKYMDESFVEHVETYSGFVARIIQHEYDHLEGKMFVDYLSPLKRKLMKTRLLNITKGKVTPKYKIRVPV